MDDESLLRRFAATRSEDAFRSLVQRHLGMVLGVAYRRTGSHSLAEEAAQNVFVILARKAGRLNARPSLSAWLYRTTLLECAGIHRRNHAHARKMNALSQHVLHGVTGRSVWQDALPVLDEAINSLPPADREVILLRFFERKSFREIGTALGKGGAAAQKQCERALQKLSALLRRKGVAITAATLATGLGAQVAGAAPAALVQAVSEGALLQASQFSAKVLLLQTLEAMTNTKLKTAAAVAVAAAIPLTLLWSANHGLREQLAQLRQQLDLAKSALKASGPARPSSLVAMPRARRPEVVAPVAPVSPAVQAVFAATPDDWERALFDPNPLQRAQRIAQLLAGLTAEQAPHVAQVFERAKSSGIRFGEEHRLFLRAWGGLDGQAAVQSVARVNENGVKSTPELLAALAGWAAVHPGGARAWVEYLPDGATKEDVIHGLLDGWSIVDFSGAAAYAESRPRSEARNRFRQLLMERALAAGGLAGAQQWVSRISDNEHNSLYKERAFSEVIQAMLYRDPSAAAHWIAQMGGKPFVTGDTVVQTAARLAEGSPAQAMHWLQTLNGPDGQHITEGQAKVLESWAKQDANAAGTWLGQNRSHPGYDQMAGSYARAIAQGDPQTALAWAQSISSEEARNNARVAVAGEMLRTSGDAALQQLQAAGYTPEMIELAQAQASQGATEALAYMDASVERLWDIRTGQALARSESLAGSLSEGLSGFFSTSAVTGTGDGVDYGWEYQGTNPHGTKYQGMNCSQCHGGDSPPGAGSSVQTDRATLLRRLSLDYRGVPPTPKEQAAFMNGDVGSSYSSVVEYLRAAQGH